MFCVVLNDQVILIQISHCSKQNWHYISIEENVMPNFYCFSNDKLSPKRISSVPHSLSPWVNQFPHTHSAETETHNHFRPKSAESFDLPGFFRQKSDRLDHCFIFQGQFCYFLPIHRNRKIEHNLPNPVTIFLLLRI